MPLQVRSARGRMAGPTEKSPTTLVAPSSRALVTGENQLALVVARPAPTDDHFRSPFPAAQSDDAGESGSSSRPLMLSLAGATTVMTPVPLFSTSTMRLFPTPAEAAGGRTIRWPPGPR